MNNVSFESKNGQNITISAVLNFPPGFEESKKYPAVVVAHLTNWNPSLSAPQ